MQFVFASFVAIICTVLVTAKPNGAPVCNIGAANVQDQHLSSDRKPDTGSNEYGQYRTILAGKQIIANIADPTFSNLFDSGVENTLVVQSGAGNYLKGLLVIASGGIVDDIDSLDTRGPAALTITDTTRTREPVGCVGVLVSAVGHTEPSEKTRMTMNFKWPTSGQRLFIDVNIVKNNNDTLGSQYYYTQYPVLSGPSKASKSCGLLGLSIFCPLTLCGIFGRLLGLCNDN